MGTRSLTRLFDEDNNEICVLYRQMDGYPEGHGKELAEFLSGFKVVNGYDLDLHSKGKYANGAHCLAAQIISHFKTGIGSFYLYPTGTTDMGEEYVYKVECNSSGELTLRCEEVTWPPSDTNIEKFVGKPEEYKDWITLLEDV